VTRGVVILGSTGSIGQQALEVIQAYPDELQVIGLAAGRNLDRLAEQVRIWSPAYVSAPTLEPGQRWQGALVLNVTDLCQVAEAERVLISTVGSAGLAPTLAAIQAHKTVALANKEVLVMAGEPVLAEARRHGATILPVDSEHSALWQCLVGDCVVGTGEAIGPVERLVLTASGGAFRDLAPDQLVHVTRAQALAHPNWVMGPKVTIDSATLMNKGFEVIEAHWLFGVPFERIDVVLHRESIVHGLVEFVDGTFKAALGPPDMRLPVQYALTYPHRRPGRWPRLHLEQVGRLSFAPLPPGRYPCFDLALAAAKAGGTAPAVLAAADDVAVESFLAGRISFADIGTIVDDALQHQPAIAHPTIDDAVAVDLATRRQVLARVGGRAANSQMAER
jgi:1-deoxy-D-xylulose-5-phosphate reductoisomerase